MFEYYLELKIKENGYENECLKVSLQNILYKHR